MLEKSDRLKSDWYIVVFAMKFPVARIIGRYNPKDKRPLPLDLPIVKSNDLQGKTQRARSSVG